MKHLLLWVLLAPLTAFASDVDDALLSPSEAVEQCVSWNYKADMGSMFFHKADASEEACHFHFGKGQYSKNAVEFCKSAHAQGVIELLFQRCLDAVPTGGLYSKNLLAYCDKTFYDWTNDESYPKPVPAFTECREKLFPTKQWKP